MTKAIEDAANALAIRTALGVPTNAELAAVSDVAEAAYVKPADGIPHNDLHTGIRDQLDLADTALQPGALPVGTTVTAAQISDAGAAGRTLLQKATLPEIQSLVSDADIIRARVAVGSGSTIRADAVPPLRCDVLVYGAAPAGLFAAMRAAEQGVRVVVIEPSTHVGGMLTAGIAKTDYRIHADYGAGMNGLTAEFFRECSREVGQNDYEGKTFDQWNYPCQVFQRVLNRMLSDRGIVVYTGWQLLDSSALEMRSGQILGATFQKASNTATTQQVRAKVYIGAHYHSDIGRQAGVTYYYGRDAAATYGETGAGVTAANLTFAGVDPYVTPGVSASGLLPGFVNSPIPTAGTASPLGMWDCYRTVTTNDPALRVPFPEPATYDPLQYELLGRWIAQGGGPQTLSAAITRYDIKEDCRGITVAAGKLVENWNNLNISFNKPGGYPTYWNATHASRAAQDLDLHNYTLGLIKWFKTDSRVSAAIKTELAEWGFLAGEPADILGMPPLPYRRESGRMTGAQYVVTRGDMEGARVAPQPIAWGCYGWDIHFCGGWFNGTALQIEGLVAGNPTNRYGIDIGALLPAPTVCRNYIEACNIGCSHLAWGSIRIEPTLMSIGEAAGTIAGAAVRLGKSAHSISSQYVRDTIGFKKLGALGQLAVSGTANLSGTVTQTQTYGTVVTVGSWDYEAAPIGWTAESSGCFHDRTTGKGTKTVTYTPTISAIGGPGVYEVYINAPAKWSADFTDSPTVPVTVNFNGAQSQAVSCDFLHGDWQSKLVGVFRFTGAGTENVIISNTGTTGRTRVNAVQFVRVGP